MIHQSIRIPPRPRLSAFVLAAGGALLAGLFASIPSGARAQEPNPFCASAPRQQWVSAEEVGQKLREAGYELVRLRMADDKCYGAVARDADGRIHDLIVHPVTVEIIR